MAFFKNKKTEQEEEKLKIVQQVQSMYKNAYDSKSSYHDIWDKCFKAYTGELFKKNLPDYKSQEVSNFIFSTVESIKPIMLADNPQFIALAQEPSYTQKSNNVQSILDYEWLRTKMFSKLQLCCSTGLIFGTIPIALVWDGTSQNGLGDVKPIPISPFNFFVDPMATNIDDAEYAMYAVYKNVGEIIKAYPSKKEMLLKSTSAPTDEFLSYGRDTSNIKADKNILYIECYMKDYSTVVEEVEENGEKYKVTKMKYPNGRFITIAGDVLLEDKENPYEDGKFPFVLWKCYDIPGKFWGMGEVEQIISPQSHICDLMNNILDSAKLTSNPIWIVDKNAGVEKNSLTNRHGLVVRKNPGTEIRRESPPNLPAYIQNIIETLYKHMEIIPGVYDVTRGERPSGITAGVAIQALTESAQGRIKLKVQALEQMLGELGSMWLRRIRQFWYTKRTVRTIGSNYEPTYEQFDKDDIDGDYDVIIASGSTMPINKTAKLQQIIQMAQTMAEDGLPMIDRKTVLENADLQNIEEILQRFESLKQMQQQQAEIQQQQQMEQQMMAQEQEAQANEIAHNQELEKIDLQHKNNMEKSYLQTGQADLQSNGNEELMQLVALLQEISNMNPDEILKLAEENPEIAKLLDIISNLPEDVLAELQQQIPNNPV